MSRLAAMSQSVNVGSDRFLLEATLVSSTIKKYKKAVHSFLQWCKDNQHSANNNEQLDDLLTQYFHELYELNDGMGKGFAADTLYGIMKYMPRTKNQLPTAEQSLRGWMKSHPAQSYPPITWDLAVVMACQMSRHGLLRHAIATLLAFDCFLRVGELVNLRKCDVADNGDQRMGSEYHGMALRLRQTKTGPNQWVQVEDENVKILVRMLLALCPNDNAKLFPFSAAQFRNVFKMVRDELGLCSQYVPHSLRHGGATRWHLLGKPLEDILLRGRWSSIKSARRYVQSGRAMLLSVGVPESISKCSAKLVKNILVSIYLSLPLPQ
jgi:integrase